MNSIGTMAEVVLTGVHTTNFIAYESLFLENNKEKDIKALWHPTFLQFMRNKVYFTFKVNDLKSDAVYEYFDRISDEIRSYCDSNCTGLWTVDLEMVETQTPGTATMIGDNKVTGVDAFVMFEYTEDRDQFMKECGLILRLSN